MSEYAAPRTPTRGRSSSQVCQNLHEPLSLPNLPIEHASPSREIFEDSTQGAEPSRGRLRSSTDPGISAPSSVTYETLWEMKIIRSAISNPHNHLLEFCVVLTENGNNKHKVWSGVPSNDQEWQFKVFSLFLETLNDHEGIEIRFYKTKAIRKLLGAVKLKFGRDIPLNPEQSFEKIFTINRRDIEVGNVTVEFNYQQLIQHKTPPELRTALLVSSPDIGILNPPPTPVVFLNPPSVPVTFGDSLSQTQETKCNYEPNLALQLVYCAQLAYETPDTVKSIASNVWKMERVQFLNDSETDTQGFCMHDERKLVVSFRGTESKKDWTTNIKFPLVRPTIYPARFNEVKAHLGFNRSMEAVWPQVQQFVDQAYERHPHLKLYVTGHSLGGALALLCYSYFVLSDTPRRVAAIYTLGQPPVGNEAFCTALMLNSPNTTYIRITNNNDCVPQLFIPGAQHGKTHLHISPSGSFQFDPSHLSNAQNFVFSLSSRDIGPFSDHPVARYRKRIEMHWISYYKPDRLDSLDLCNRVIFLSDLLRASIKPDQAHAKTLFSIHDGLQKEKDSIHQWLARGDIESGNLAEPLKSALAEYDAFLCKFYNLIDYCQTLRSFSIINSYSKMKKDLLQQFEIVRSTLAALENSLSQPH